MKFNVAITVHENNLGIVLAQNAELCHLFKQSFMMKSNKIHLAVKAALKLHSQVVEVVAS